MISPSFPSTDYLSSLSVEQLRRVDIRDKEEEDIIQEIINSKLGAMRVVNPVTPKEMRVPDINTKEEEELWQKKIDEENAKRKEVVLKVVKKKSVQEPVLSSSPKPVPEYADNICPICKKEFKNSNGVRLHSKVHK